MTKEHKAIREALDAIFLTICPTMTWPSGQECQQGRITLEQYNIILATLDSIMAGGGVPDGYVMVPIAPTREMYEHGVMAKDVMFTTGAGLNTSYFPVGAIYQAMLSAAPKHGGE